MIDPLSWITGSKATSRMRAVLHIEKKYTVLGSRGSSSGVLALITGSVLAGGLASQLVFYQSTK